MIGEDAQKAWIKTLKEDMVKTVQEFELLEVKEIEGFIIIIIIIIIEDGERCSHCGEEFISEEACQ